MLIKDNSTISVELTIEEVRAVVKEHVLVQLEALAIIEKRKVGKKGLNDFDINWAEFNDNPEASDILFSMLLTKKAKV